MSSRQRLMWLCAVATSAVGCGSKAELIPVCGLSKDTPRDETPRGNDKNLSRLGELTKLEQLNLNGATVTDEIKDKPPTEAGGAEQDSPEEDELNDEIVTTRRLAQALVIGLSWVGTDGQ